MLPLLLLAAAAGATPLNPADWVTAHDYPAEALQAGAHGKVGFALALDADGRPTDCTITAPSGSDALDGRTCVLMMERGRFTPAHDDAGRPIASRYANSVTWEIPEGAGGGSYWVEVARTGGVLSCRLGAGPIAALSDDTCDALAATFAKAGKALPQRTQLILRPEE